MRGERETKTKKKRRPETRTRAAATQFITRTNRLEVRSSSTQPIVTHRETQQPEHRERERDCDRQWKRCKHVLCHTSRILSTLFYLFYFFHIFIYIIFFLFSVDIYLFIAYCIGHCVFIYISRSLCVCFFFIILCCKSIERNDFALPCGSSYLFTFARTIKHRKKVKNVGPTQSCFTPLNIINIFITLFSIQSADKSATHTQRPLSRTTRSSVSDSVSDSIVCCFSLSRQLSQFGNFNSKGVELSSEQSTPTRPLSHTPTQIS